METHRVGTETNDLGPYIKMPVSGKKFHFLYPSPEMICLEDIAHNLTHICRYTGGTSPFYSVAEHSMLVADIVEDARNIPHALLHDASEAYLGDVSSPLKSLLPEYRIIEANVQEVIYRKYCGNEWVPSIQVKIADDAMFEQEYKHFVLKTHDADIFKYDYDFMLLEEAFLNRLKIHFKD